MTYTAEQLRVRAETAEQMLIYVDPSQLRAHAAALETIAKLERELAKARETIAKLSEDVVMWRAEASRRGNEALATASDEISKRERAEAECERLRPDAERYRWLQSEAKQVYMHPNAEIDNRMRWEFPVLIALTCINSEVSLNAAIDAARRK